jgi:hypothetical protein
MTVTSSPAAHTPPINEGFGHEPWQGGQPLMKTITHQSVIMATHS